MKKKLTTIDDLARMVQEAFAESKKQMDERFTHVDEQVAQVQHALRAIRKDPLGVVYRPQFDDLQERVRDVEDMIAPPKRKAA